MPEKQAPDAIDQTSAEDRKTSSSPESMRRNYFRTWLGLMALFYVLFLIIPIGILAKNFGWPREWVIGITLVLAFLLALRAANTRTDKKFGQKPDGK